MFRFVSWKIQKLLRIFKTEGGGNTVDFALKKAKQKFTDLTNTVLRKQQERRLRSEFSEIWKANAKTNHPRRVLLLVSTYFDLDGKDFMQGGAERYIFELHRLITSLGGELEVYQCARSNWHNTIHGIPVYGLNTNGYNLNLLNQAFHKWVPEGCLSIYFQMMLSTPYCHKSSICVSHGVDWDAHWLQSSLGRYQSWIRTILSSIKNVEKLVSVDTNTINWIRATDSQKSEKCVYIPNFVDTQQFKGVESSGDNLVILYPRRLSEARGFWIMAAVLPRLLEQYPNIEFRFCGKAEAYEQFEVNNLCKNYPERVLFYDSAPDQMPAEYQKANIVVIPTRYSEGTSLSCLEALASCRAVITSNVGGLPDLILPEYNGLLIEPNETSLYAALNWLINDPELREKLAHNGYQTAKVFDIAVWRERWQAVLRPYLDHA